MISIRVDGSSFQRSMSGVAQQQYPFALALALTRTAEEAVREEIKELPRTFIIRNQWVAKGWRVKRATKADPVAEAQHKDPYMYLQEVGGEKRPVAARQVAVPKGARPTPQSTTPRSKWPGKVSRKFTITKGDTTYLYSRTGRRTGGKVGRKHLDRRFGPRPRDPNLKLMYVMKSSVKVKPRLGARARVQRTINTRFAVNLEGFMDFALRTAR